MKELKEKGEVGGAEEEKERRKKKERGEKLLEIWVDTHFYYFRENTHLKKELSEVIDKVIHPNSKLQDSLKQLFLSRSLLYNERNFKNLHSFENLSKAPPPLFALPPSSSLTTLKVSCLHPEELSRQLTLLEWKPFLRVSPNELCKKRWKHFANPKTDNKSNNVSNNSKSPNITQLINLSNKISFWVCNEILNAESEVERKETLKTFIRTAKYLKKLKNYNSLFSVMSGLQMHVIARLKSLWNSLPSKSLDTFKQLQTLVSPDNNFAHYRKVLSKSDKSLFPYIGLLSKTKNTLSFF